MAAAIGVSGTGIRPHAPLHSQGMLNWLTASGAGVIGAVAMTIMTDTSRALGLIEANMSRYQGCLVTGRSEGWTALAAGLATHLMIGAVLALGYAIVFRLVGQATWATGAITGFVHWGVAGLAFPIMDRMNPCVADGRIRGFGIMGKNYGTMMILGLMMGHVLYGAIVGALYALPAP